MRGLAIIRSHNKKVSELQKQFEETIDAQKITQPYRLFGLEVPRRRS